MRSNRRRTAAPLGMRGMEAPRGVKRADKDFFYGSASGWESRAYHYRKLYMFTSKKYSIVIHTQKHKVPLLTIVTV